MFLKKSQKSELGEIIVRYGMKPADFHFRENDAQSTIELKHKESDAYFIFSLTNTSEFNVEFTPSATTANETYVTRISWSNVLNLAGSWIKYLLEELRAEDPWADAEVSDEFEDDPESLFTPAELVTIDSAIDASFEKLVSEANENGLEKKIDDVLSEITELKELARTTPRAKWLERFKEAIAAKLIDWGLDLAIGTGVLAVLYQVAKPVLKLVADLQ